MWRRTLLLSAVAGTLGACGFRLRGTTGQPAYALRITGASGPVTQALIKQLRRDKVAVTVDGDAPAAGEADYTLVVLDDQRIRTVQATNTSGQVREIRLRVEFRWTLVDAKNNEIVAPTTALYEQDLSFSEVQVLGKADEEASNFETLQQRTVTNVINQLSRVGR